MHDTHENIHSQGSHTVSLNWGELRIISALLQRYHLEQVKHLKYLTRLYNDQFFAETKLARRFYEKRSISETDLQKIHDDIDYRAELHDLNLEERRASHVEFDKLIKKINVALFATRGGSSET